MALVFIDGFDYYDASTATARGWTNAPTSTPAGRFGGQAWRYSASGSGLNRTASIALPSTYTTLYLGFAWRFSAIGTNQRVELRAGTGTATFQIALSSGGLIQILNSSGTVIATGTTVLNIDTWYYVEAKAFINTGTPASGSCEVYLNGASEIASTNGNFGSTALDHLTIFANFTSTTMDVDDIYILDTTGADNNSWLGDVRVATIMPDGAGTHTAWTPNGAASNYQCTDEIPANSDTDYVSDATPGDIDTYSFADIDGGATVYGVQANLFARKDDANLRQIAPVIRQGGTDYVGSTVTLSSSYLYYSELYDKDPASAAWTAANVNNDEFGVKEIA